MLKPAYLAHSECGGNRAWANILWYKYKQSMWPDVKTLSITQSALNPRWLMGRWKAHHVHRHTNSRK